MLDEHLQKHLHGELITNIYHGRTNNSTGLISPLSTPVEIEDVIGVYVTTQDKSTLKDACNWEILVSLSDKYGPKVVMHFIKMILKEKEYQTRAKEVQDKPDPELEDALRFKEEMERERKASTEQEDYVDLFHDDLDELGEAAVEATLEEILERELIDAEAYLFPDGHFD